MSPEISGQLRQLLGAVAAFMVAAGWLAADKVDAFVGYSVSGVGLVVGGITLVLPFYLSWKAKKPESPEAKVIAAKVIVAKVPIAVEVAQEKEKVEAEAK